MSIQNGRAFNEWLRTQLKAKKMSQRQLAQQSGVDHSTISRLVRGDRTPSLGTATNLRVDFASCVTKRRHRTTSAWFSHRRAIRPREWSTHCAQMILLSEPQVRQVMEYYLALRMRRLAAARQSGNGARAGTPQPGPALVARMPNRN